MLNVDDHIKKTNKKFKLNHVPLDASSANTPHRFFETTNLDGLQYFYIRFSVRSILVRGHNSTSLTRFLPVVNILRWFFSFTYSTRDTCGTWVLRIIRTTCPHTRLDGIWVIPGLKSPLSVLQSRSFGKYRVEIFNTLVRFDIVRVTLIFRGLILGFRKSVT